MRRLLPLAVLAVSAAACSGGKSDAVSLSQVKRVLGAAQIDHHKVKLTVTIEKQGAPPPGPVNYCAAEAVGQAFATSLEVDHGRAIVIVFNRRRDADAWMPRPECGAQPMRVANVIAVPTQGHISRRLRAALQKLRR
jgi:hypothetical protein